MPKKTYLSTNSVVANLRQNLTSISSYLRYISSAVYVFPSWALSLSLEPCKRLHAVVRRWCFLPFLTRARSPWPTAVALGAPRSKKRKGKRALNFCLKILQRSFYLKTGRKENQENRKLKLTVSSLLFNSQNLAKFIWKCIGTSPFFIPNETLPLRLRHDLNRISNSRLSREGSIFISKVPLVEGGFTVSPNLNYYLWRLSYRVYGSIVY